MRARKPSALNGGREQGWGATRASKSEVTEFSSWSCGFSATRLPWSGHVPTLDGLVGPAAVRSSALVVWKGPAAVLGSSQATTVTATAAALPAPLLLVLLHVPAPLPPLLTLLLSAATVTGRTNGIHLCQKKTKKQKNKKNNTQPNQNSCLSPQFD